MFKLKIEFNILVDDDLIDRFIYIDYSNNYKVRALPLYMRIWCKGIAQGSPKPLMMVRFHQSVLCFLSLMDRMGCYGHSDVGSIPTGNIFFQ